MEISMIFASLYIKYFIAMVNYAVNYFSVLSTEGSSLCILSWSLGAASVISAYGTLIPTKIAQVPNWPSYFSKIILYEPPSDVAFGLGPWNPTEANVNAPIKSLPPKEQIAEFSRRVGGYYN
jgi:hypothetical protein